MEDISDVAQFIASEAIQDVAAGEGKDDGNYLLLNEVSSLNKN